MTSTAKKIAPAQEPAEVPVASEEQTVPPKTWGTLNTGTVSNKTSFSSIMAEQEEKEKKEREHENAKRVAQQEEMELKLVMEASLAASSAPEESVPFINADMDKDMRLAIELSLKDGGEASETVASSAAQENESNVITADEAEQIEKALREADKAEADQSLSLAMQLQNEEDRLYTSGTSSSRGRRSAHDDGHVRIMTREELLREQAEASYRTNASYFKDIDDLDTAADEGFRMNSTKPSKQWSRLDRATIVGPNQELRTKHDVQLQGQANAHRLGLDDDTPHFVGNRAYNSFRQSMQRKTNKGVAAHGHGRATADTDKTKQGGMDSRVRWQITKAINSGLIECCNGVVKEGKEAIVYHANEGKESGGHDVAIKVFKRIQEFKERYSYVDGDPRYLGRKFNNAGNREQLEIWAEKEHRNLVRASRGGVPVPTPLLQKENMLFMRFLGEEGWPSPQLKELGLKKGSKKWKTLYSQTMGAIRRLYHKGRLVHGDLSEYNILVCPSHLVENRITENDGDETAVQIVLIDFGQAVDVRHPSSLELLQRDILRVKEFFDKMGVKTMSTKVSEAFVLTWDDVADDTKHENELKNASELDEAASSVSFKTDKDGSGIEESSEVATEKKSPEKVELKEEKG